MKPSKLLISAYLCLVLSFAGEVGINPFLHQLIEHGGDGAPHVHPHLEIDEPPFASNPDHVHDHVSVDHDEIAHDFENALDNMDYFRQYRWQDDEPTDLDESKGHHHEEKSEQELPEGHSHQSLAQMMATGLIEQPLDLPTFQHFLPETIRERIVRESRRVASRFDPATAGRAPPIL